MTQLITRPTEVKAEPRKPICLMCMWAGTAIVFDTPEDQREHIKANHRIGR